MSKLLVIPSKKKDFKLDVDGFIISIKSLSVSGNFYIDIKVLEPLVTYLKQNKKEVFISLNKNMFNKDLPLLEETLKLLNKLDIKGILYYDLSILELVQKLKLNLPLIWSEEHLTTNYLTCNYYAEKGVKGVYLSAEITLKEVCEIVNKTKLITILPIFGYIPMFNSKRHVLQNYLKTFGLKTKSKINYLEKDGNLYPIIDNKNETVVYSSHILNGLKEYLSLKVTYVTLNSFNIKEFDKIVKMYKSVTEENVLKYEEEINNLYPNVDKGFLYKETIYKVKK